MKFTHTVDAERKDFLLRKKQNVILNMPAADVPDWVNLNVNNINDIKNTLKEIIEMIQIIKNDN